MSNPEIISAAANMRGYVASQYHQRGPRFGYAFAQAYIEEIAGGVVQLESRAAAGKMLMNVTDAILAGVPVQEINFTPGCVLLSDAPVPTRREYLWRDAFLWGLAGFLSFTPIIDALRWATGW